MNRRRELTLQRLARIGALPASESAVQTEKPETIAKIKPVGTLSIEAMLGIYMMRQKGVYAQFEHDLRTQQDSYISTSKDPKQHLSQQMAEYMAAIEESQLANARAGVSYDKSSAEIDKENQEKAEYIMEHISYQQDIAVAKDEEKELLIKAAMAENAEAFKKICC